MRRTRTLIVAAAGGALVMLISMTIAVAQLLGGGDQRAAPPPTTPESPVATKSEPDGPEVDTMLDVDGVPVRLQETVEITRALVDQVRLAISYTQLYNTRDCSVQPYPGFDVARVTEMTIGPLAEDLAYQRQDWDHPRDSDVEACAAGPAITADVTAAAVPAATDGRQLVIITYTSDTGVHLESVTIGYTITTDPQGRWKLAELDENPPLHF